MILDELILHDVGLFAGRNVLSLTPPSAGKPITLVGGLNGAGKTTILEAIHLALYGPLAAPSSRRSGSYDTYLRSLIHNRANPTQGSSIELAFSAHSQGELHRYRVIRSWKSTPSGTRDRLVVKRDEVVDKTLTATWPESVDGFIPRGIAGLFFFDGEQIESLADLDRSREVLASALSSLLGLDLVDRLSTDLTAIRRRHRDARVPTHLRDKVEAAQASASQLRQIESDAVTRQAELRSAAERADKELHEATGRWRDAGGDLSEKRVTAELNLVACLAESEEIEARLREFAAGAAPLLQVLPHLAEVAERAREEHLAERHRVVLDVLSARDKAVIRRLRSSKAQADAVRQLEGFLREDRDQRRAASAIEPVTELSDPWSVEYLNEEVLPSVRGELQALLKQWDRSRSNLVAAERLLAAIPDPESLQAVVDERSRAETKALQARSALEHAEEQLEMIRRDRARADVAYERVLAEATDATLAAEDELRIVTHIDHVQDTLVRLRERATERHVERIAGLVLEALRRLLRKDDLITAIRIDPLGQSVELTGSMGQIINAQELSAGERQLLAVALLWGLAQAAGQPLPVVIDTPLGRLDSSHRGHLLERYFPFASHQVLLLSTDTEIDIESHQLISKFIGHEYRLEFDSTRGATTIAPGYFWKD